MSVSHSRTVNPKFQRISLWIALYGLMLPTILGMAVFDYYPKIDVVIMSFFRWEPPTVMEYIGLNNFIDAAADPLFWQSFQLILILLVVNLLKMWPGIFAAVALHRLSRQGLRYFYQVLFVIPMVVPGLVWLLVWKSFYDPDFGILNRFLNLTGTMQLLQLLDGVEGAPGIMPRIADALAPVMNGVVSPLFGNIWGMLIFGCLIISVSTINYKDLQQRATFIHLMSVPALWTVGLLAGMGGSMVSVLILMAISIYLFIRMGRAMGGFWVLWFIWTSSMVALFYSSPQYLLLLPLIAIGIVYGIYRRADFFTGRSWCQITGWTILLGGSFLVVFGMIWTEPTGQFAEGAPAWLGNTDLVIPAILFWGFPWVGTIGVLIYLSGLQQISQDVYEAAELDGVGPIGMLFRIELPLMMTQVRINLIFMTIGTLTTYEFFLLLLGPDGGPGNKGMVPGLYMYKKAFEDGHFGYACALGMLLFFIVLGLTIVYNKYVKVEK
jgi:ABC-type sugar transport system permease subunit